MVGDGDFVKWFEEIGKDDLTLVGGKNASLGEMIRELRSSKVEVPGGFALTTDAYRLVLEQDDLELVHLGSAGRIPHRKPGSRRNRPQHPYAIQSIGTARYLNDVHHRRVPETRRTLRSTTLVGGGKKQRDGRGSSPLRVLPGSRSRISTSPMLTICSMRAGIVSQVFSRTAP